MVARLLWSPDSQDGGVRTRRESIETPKRRNLIQSPPIRSPGNVNAPGEEGPKLHPATFVGGRIGSWHVERIVNVRGTSLPLVSHVHLIPSLESKADTGSGWVLRGITEADHYTTPAEQMRLRSVQPKLGRQSSTRAALIPIRKSPEWWGLASIERRAIFEERSHHIATGLEFLPRIARRLYHSRALGEPFDFLTWFEFDPKDAPAFDQLLQRLRATQEWRYVEREVEIRLRRPEALRGQ